MPKRKRKVSISRDLSPFAGVWVAYIASPIAGKILGWVEAETRSARDAAIAAICKQCNYEEAQGE